MKEEENVFAAVAESDIEFLDRTPEEVLEIAFNATGKIRDNFETLEACVRRLRSDYKK